MTHASRLLRRVEITLCVLGVVLLGAALGETVIRWNYQAQQERALQRGPALSVSSTEERAIAVAVDRGAGAAGVEGLARVVESSSGRVVESSGGRVVESEEDRAAEVLDVTEGRTERTAASAQPTQSKRIAADADSTAFGRIEIPRLGVAAIVKEGADQETLARAVGLVRGSARPGQLGNMVLAGHRDTFFRPLRRIKLDDRIRVIVPPHTYEYRVQSLRVVAPEETNVLDSRGVEELTLVTCYPFRFVGSAPERFIVNAARVN